MQSRQLEDPRLVIFLDNCVWIPLLELGVGSPSPNDVARRVQLVQYLDALSVGAAVLVFSPCLLADVPQNVRIAEFEERLRPFEDAGYATLLEPSSDWRSLGLLRERMRSDLSSNPVAFSHVPADKRKVGFGDVAAVFAAIRSGSHEMWTYDPMLLAYNGRSSVRRLTIVEPHPLVLQGNLFSSV